MLLLKCRPMVQTQDQEANFKAWSLRELSLESAQIAAIVENADEEDGLDFQELQEYLSQATQAKIDGYVLFKEYLEVEIETWQAKKEALAQMCDRVLTRQPAQLAGLKSTLIKLHEQGLIEDYLMGRNKAIQILANPKPTVSLLCKPEDPDFPEEFQYQQIKVKADKEAIAKASCSGKNVSGFAQVTWGKQVRFKNAPRQRRKK
jgi:hypothetical protein